MKLAKEFVKFVAGELNLTSLPKSIKFEGDEYAAQHLTFGTYNPSTDEIVVVKGSRHPVDVLRTLAHELVHHQQRIENRTLDGGDGSPAENEANAVAGVLMRKFRTMYPSIFTEIFNVGPWGFHTNIICC
jgi:Zn-dependent peptidase ImmA (M78 family)